MTKENKNKYHHHNQHDEKRKQKQRITMVCSWFYTGDRKKNQTAGLSRRENTLG